MTHQTPNPHDAEEAMRPYLGRVHDAQEAWTAMNAGYSDPAWSEARDAWALTVREALDKALELLGVQS